MLIRYRTRPHTYLKPIASRPFAWRRPLGVARSIDGKQARRTRSSSPLGQLFDHGCDALSVGLLLDSTHCSMDYPCGYVAAGIVNLVSVAGWCGSVGGKWGVACGAV